MTDHSPLAAGRGELPAERESREARHQLLIDLLGAYADRELPPETTSQLDAHLVGCERCRRELAVHHALRDRLGAEPLVAAPPAFRDRIAASVAAIPRPVAPPAAAPSLVATHLARRVIIAAGAIAAIVILALAARVVVARTTAPLAHGAPAARVLAAPGAVPLVRDVLADYRRVTAGDLPGRARDLDAVRSAMPFPITPIRAGNLRLLAAWTTDLAGEPAAVLAYRWDDRIVVQYLVSEERFFHHPEIRAAVAGGRVLESIDGAQGIVAWPTAAAGTLLIGDMTPTRLAPLAGAALANAVERGAP